VAYVVHSKQGLGDRSQPDRARRGTLTHLAVYFRCNIEAKHIEDYGYKGTDARDGVNL
jgi:hypothetical protein